MAKVGRPLSIETPDEMWELFVEFRKSKKEDNIMVIDFVGKDAHRVEKPHQRPLTMEGFSAWLFEQGVCKDVWQYFSNLNGAYEQFLGITARIREIIRTDQIEGGMVGIYNSNLTARINGLAEKSESKVEAKVEQIDYSQLSESTLNEIAKLKS